MIISDAYRDLNRQLHETNEHYGANGHRWVLMVAKLCEDEKLASVLDFGCGKGSLKWALGKQAPALDVREYDPSVPGKDSEPERADLVVCTDVLEHIEPDCLDAVLDKLRKLSKARAFVNISTRPAMKTLADGRNAHLIVEDADWWHERLSRYFEIKDWVPRIDSVSGVLLPLLAIGEIKSVGAVSDAERLEQTKINIKVTDRRLNVVKAHNGTAILVCYGPSLNESWPAVNVERSLAPEAVVVSVSGAHDFLVNRDIVPDYHVECDPRPHKAAMVKQPQDKTDYLLASCVHHDMIAALRGKKVTLWHLHNGPESYKVRDIEPNAYLVAGGGSVGLRAICVLYLMGYRRFIIHGMDCSFKEQQHAGPHTGKVQKPMKVKCGETWFETSAQLITYARHFQEMARHLCPPTGDVDMVLHGDGLLQEMTRISCAQPQSEAA